MVGVLVHLIDKSSQMLDFGLVEGELRRLLAARGFTPTKISGSPVECKNFRLYGVQFFLSRLDATRTCRWKMFEVGNQASLMSVQYKEPESDLPILSQKSASKNLALRNLFVPVATTLKELSSLMGSRVGVKRWKDFAFFQATNQSDSLRQVITSRPFKSLQELLCQYVYTCYFYHSNRVLLLRTKPCCV